MVALLLSPIGPALILGVGALVELILGRWLRRPGWLTGLALFFVGLAGILLLGLRSQPVVPVFSRPWQPLLQNGANLLWVGDGWNWYISGLVLLLGGLGILLELNTDRSQRTRRGNLRIHVSLAVHLGILGASLLFVGAGNLLTVVLTWVVVDILVLVRSAVRIDPPGTARALMTVQESRAKGLSLIGALLLLIALLLAGPDGPGQPLQGGVIPLESALLLVLAAAIRAGIYPFHLWLMPSNVEQVDLAERLLDHVVPVLGGLWLLGWATGLGADYLLMRPLWIGLAVVSLLGSAWAAWTAREQPYHTTFVLITSAGLGLLVGLLAFNPGPGTLIWPTTVFALGGGLWLVGERVWEGWGWQLPVSVGALALAGLPFTPGFLSQPDLSRLLTSGGIFTLFFWLFVLAQGLQIAAMLRSWGREQRIGAVTLREGDTVRLLVASFALGLPLAVAGFLPRALAALASLPNALPPLVGSPPAVVAEMPVWITLSLPMIVGIALVWLRPLLWAQAGPLFDRLGRLARLEWLFDISWWGVNQGSNIWGNALRVVEGPGYIGWAAVLALLGYLLIR
ncbi:MAG: hypothetical protein R2851_26680 [Caldilineaceae bacterium]